MNLHPSKRDAKVIFESITLGNFFVEYDWDSDTNVLWFGKDSIWATEPKMKLDFSKAIDEDIEAFMEIGIPEGHKVDWDTLCIEHFIVNESMKTVEVAYVVNAHSSEMDINGSYRFVFGYKRQIKGIDCNAYDGKPGSYQVGHRPFNFEQKLKIPW